MWRHSFETISSCSLIECINQITLWSKIITLVLCCNVCNFKSINCIKCIFCGIDVIAFRYHLVVQVCFKRGTSQRPWTIILSHWDIRLITFHPNSSPLYLYIAKKACGSWFLSTSYNIFEKIHNKCISPVSTLTLKLLKKCTIINYPRDFFFYS